MTEPTPNLFRRSWKRVWPWLVLALIAAPAFWHVIDFPDDIDTEYPKVERPTFSRRPPPAYRLAEPGDTIDRIAIYVASLAVVLSLSGTLLERSGPRLWPSALGLSLAALWHAATPGPAFDGWHGLGWRVIADAAVPLALRAALAFAALLLLLMILGPLYRRRHDLRRLWQQAGVFEMRGLLATACLLVLLRQVELPNVEPAGYWPRWFFDFGLVAFNLALVRAMPALEGSYPRLRRCGFTMAGAGTWFALVVGGIWLTWYHRPLERLRTIEPGKIYMSAMPTARGLEVAQARHHFRTIINLFPEDTPFRSSRHPEELEFARRYGVRYLGSPADEASSAAFLRQTLALSRDPSAWPILVHCHGCMDRTPAWMGIYRFVFQARPLQEIFQEIERHRGYRPKASVILLYNRVLPMLDPAHYAMDPTAQLLKRCAHGTVELLPRLSGNPPGTANHAGGYDVSPLTPLPSLTPPRRSLESKHPKTHRDPLRPDSASPS